MSRLLESIPDPIYGEINIYNPKILKIIKLPIFERLRGIKQAGIDAIIDARKSCTRYEHSLGTYELLRRLGADETEQIVGLLHDIYHTNFSHTLDMLGNPTKSLHEAEKWDFFKNTKGTADLINILGSNWVKYFKSEDHPLTKQDGADKIDYLLRDGYYLGIYQIKQDPTGHGFIQRVLNSLSISDNRIICVDPDASALLTNYSMDLTNKVYNSPQTKGLATLFCKALELAEQKGIMKISELKYGYNSDKEIWQKMLLIEDDEIKTILSMINPDTKFKYLRHGISNPEEGILLRSDMPSRLRYINIPINVGGISYDLLGPLSLRYHPWLEQKIKRDQLLYGGSRDLYSI